MATNVRRLYWLAWANSKS